MHQYGSTQVVLFDSTPIPCVVSGCPTAHTVSINANLNVPVDHRIILACRPHKGNGPGLVLGIDGLTLPREARMVRHNNVAGRSHGPQHIRVVNISMVAALGPSVS